MMTGAAWLTHTFATKQWGTNTKLQQLLDIWGDHPQRAILRRSEVLDMLWDFRAGVGRWVDRAKALPRRQTTLHGDFHRGNLFTRAARGASPSAEDVAIVDWAMLHEHILPRIASLGNDWDLVTLYSKATYSTWRVYFLTNALFAGTALHRVMHWAGFSYTQGLIFSPRGVRRFLDSMPIRDVSSGAHDLWIGRLVHAGQLTVYRTGLPVLRHVGWRLGGTTITMPAHADKRRQAATQHVPRAAVP